MTPFKDRTIQPVKIPNFNPVDFFAWGYIKSKVKVFRLMPATKLQVINRIRLEINHLDQEMITRVSLDIS